MEILKKYVSQDKMQPALCEIQREGEYLYATDSYILVRIKSDKEIEPNQVFNQSVMHLFDSNDQYIEIDKKINLIIKDLPKEVIKIESDELEVRQCEECDGHGYVEWTYEDRNLNDYERLEECPVCEGTGQDELPVIQKKEVIKQSLFITFKGLYFNPTLLLKIFTELDVNPLIKIAKKNMIIKLHEYEFVVVPNMTEYKHGVVFDLIDHSIACA